MTVKKNNKLVYNTRRKEKIWHIYDNIKTDFQKVLW
jgi:hypothetical protein